jgi:hypothetical protein
LAVLSVCQNRALPENFLAKTLPISCTSLGLLLKTTVTHTLTESLIIPQNEKKVNRDAKRKKPLLPQNRATGAFYGYLAKW